MWKYILFGIASVIAILMIVIALQPNDFSVTRSATFATTPDTVFPYLNSQKKANEWSPWIELDPQATFTFSGPDEGVGSSIAWDGNQNMGAGDSTITESTSNEHIVIQLHFIRPFESTSRVDYTLKPEGNGTLMTWTMSGKNNYISKAMSLVMDCDAMIGAMFEKGLANLRTLVEKK